MVESLKIVALGVVAAIIYGVVHDNVTARVCVEYFTIGHPAIFGTNSPTILALGWGVLATWWVGMGLGFFLAMTCRVGRKPKLRWLDLLRPLGILLATMAVVSTIAGLSGYQASLHRWFWLNGPLMDRVPADRHDVFIADLWAHLAAYATSFLGGIILAIWATIRRHQLDRLLMIPDPDPDPEFA